MAKDSISIKLEVVDKDPGAAKRFSDNLTGHVKAMSARSIGHVKKLGLQFTKGLGGAIKKVSSGLTKLKTVAIGALLSWGINRIIGEWERLSAVQEKAEAGMMAAMKSMGRHSDEFKKKILHTASALQKLSTFGDEAIIMGAKFLMTYRDISNEIMPRVMRAMTNVAALMRGDFVSAANMLGKASMGMTGELRRVGITVDQDVYKAQGFIGILKQIEQQVEGQAEALRKTKYGGLQAFSNVLGDIKEKFGLFTSTIKEKITNVLLPTIETMNEKLAKWISSGQMEKLARKTAGDVVDALGSIIQAVGWVRKSWLALNIAWPSVVATVSAGAAIILGIYRDMVVAWEAVISVGGLWKNALVKDTETGRRKIEGFIQKLVNVVDIHQDMADGYKDSLGEIQLRFDKLKEKVAGLKQAVLGVTDASQKTSAATKTWEDKIVKVGDVWTNVRVEVTGALEQIKEKSNEVRDTFNIVPTLEIEDKASGVLGTVEDQAKKTRDAVNKSATVTVKDEATDVLRRIQAEMAKIKDKTVTVTVEHVGKGSTTRPLGEKIAEMQLRMQDFANMVGGLALQPTVDFTDISSGLSGLMELSWRMYQTRTALTTPMRWGGPPAGTREEYLREQQLWGAAMQSLYRRTGVGATTKSLSVGDIHIHVPESAAPQTAEDWRLIVREYIIPELERVGIN